jgi:phosphatidylserine decarboxylase
MRLARTGHTITLVPVAAILVAGIRLGFLGADFDIRHGGARTLSVDVPLHKGDEMGWFEHGSTIIVFAPVGFALHESVRDGAVIRVGQPLMRLPDA